MMMLPAQADMPICWASLWTLLFWWRVLCSSYFHFIHLHFLPSSSTSVSYLLLPHLFFQFLVPFPLINSSVPSYSFWTSPFHFFIYPLLFSLSSFNSNWFSSFFSLFFILTLLFLSLCFSFFRGFCNFLPIPSPWWTTNSVDKPSWLITFFLIFGLFY